MVGEAEKPGEVKVDTSTRPEIVAGAVIIRLEAGASADRIASVVRALATCQ
jgi:transposase